MIDLIDLQYFVTVAREGGVTRASEKLNRVQSNVTTRVKKLEQQLDVPLFLREGRKMILTADDSGEPHGELLQHGTIIPFGDNA